MNTQHIGWQARTTKPCRKCRKPFTPTGPRSADCPTCNPSMTTCRRCGTSYPRHKAHACNLPA